MRRFLGLALLLLLMLASACTLTQRQSRLSTAAASTAIAQKTATGRIVAARTSRASTATAEIAGRPTPTPPPTPTPRPRPASPTPRPTATRPPLPTPGLEGDIPASWPTYREPGGQYTLRYPDTWRLVGTQNDALSFQSSTFAFATITILRESLPFEESDLIDAAEKMAVTRFNLSLETQAKGPWPGTVKGAYLQGLVRDRQTLVPAQVLALYVRKDGRDVIALVVGMTVDSAERSNLDGLIASIQFGRTTD